jgi:group I intron endonuclease|nr:MAG TPA: intron associated endonuclease [Caudoviricetes sp.]
MIEDKKWTVYMHTAPNGKKYVGIASQKPESRWGHGSKYKKNKHFYNAIKKYGWDNFEHKILCSGLNVAQAGCIEQTFIRGLDLRNPANGYNKSIGGEYGTLGIHHSVEARKKMSEARKGTHLNDETRKKISESCKGKNAKAVICIETGMLYSSVTEAAESIGVTRDAVGMVARGVRKTAGGYHWKYAEDNN